MRYHYRVQGIDCPMCALSLSGMLRKIRDFQSVNLNIMTHELVIYTWLEPDELSVVLNNNALTIHGQLCYRLISAS